MKESEDRIRALEAQIGKSDQGLMALVHELEQRLAERTAELQAAHEELERTNSELLLLTLELDDRVAERTAELQAKDEEIRAMSQQLWQTAKLATMGELAASIAHELNNPLAIVSLRTEMLLGQPETTDQARRLLDIIGSEVERMGDLVKALLQFSRRSAPEVSSVDIREEIERSLELVHYHLRNHRIEVVKEFPPEVPTIHADRQQLRQLFLNLTTNASDAMPGGGTLTISVGSTSSANGRGDSPETIVVEVRDTGEGIAPENLRKVLEPFFTTKPEGKGTGLGLPICRRIVQEHGGTFEIASEVGQGTTVRVALPVSAGARNLLE